ncbi:serine hydrolase domain-containing protein [Alkalihalophilus marmarensis]|uniref:serine hydrolase domain-containing protein n=1 Tax=Alkalihalophilus marmarensis TaxID=521377 RepID=UPI002DB817C3|nr:serine hydrolase domain-containing protein [Alkalihalophilus marmarensis]MEC2072644.1 serine hydrolase [Alkalihalophilus marmarensis]
MKLREINLKQRMEHYKVNGLSIALIEDGQISGTENYGLLGRESNRKVNENSIFSACSITKFLTGMTAVKLVSEGILNLDEDVNERLLTWKVPENEYTTNKNVTLRNLLSHQSGIKDPEGSFSELHSMTDIPSVVELLEGKSSYCEIPTAPQYEPESEFHYSDAGYCIIQLLIEDVTKKPYDQVVSEFIFKPLDMRNSHLHPTRLEIDKKNFASGHNKNGDLVDGKYPVYPYPTASGLWASSLDLAALVLELMNALKGESNIGISQSLANEMITAQKGKNWAGLGVFLEETEKSLEISSMGWGVGFQCMMFAFPHLEKGAVIMTNAELGVHQLEGIIGEIYKSLNQ